MADPPSLWAADDEHVLNATSFEPVPDWSTEPVDMTPTRAGPPPYNGSASTARSIETSTSPTRVRLATRNFRLASDSTRDDSQVIDSGSGGRMVMVVGGWEGGRVAVGSRHRAVESSPRRCSKVVAVAAVKLLARLSWRRCHGQAVGAVESAPRSSHRHHPVVVTVQSSIQLLSQSAAVTEIAAAHLAQSQIPKSTTHRLPDNRQSSGSDNRHSLGGGGGRGGG
ncbi:hypothetical protein BDZ89DRAFT_1114887 [Hymenopellis radicata]|nr:hypothetical protein BDZ89DRAFT_1114887 [Hymenopellis radicata]